MQANPTMENDTKEARQMPRRECRKAVEEKLGYSYHTRFEAQEKRILHERFEDIFPLCEKVNVATK